MSRKEELQRLSEKLKTSEIYDFREELENFLQEANDSYTKALQKVISEKLDGADFHHNSFEEFLSDYQSDHPTDSAGYSDFHSRIYGE